MSRLPTAPLVPALKSLVKGKSVVITGGFNNKITKSNLDRAIKSLGASVATPNVLQQGNTNPRVVSKIGTVITGDKQISRDRVLSALNSGIAVVPASQFIRYAADQSRKTEEPKPLNLTAQVTPTAATERVVVNESPSIAQSSDPDEPKLNPQPQDAKLETSAASSTSEVSPKAKLETSLDHPPQDAKQSLDTAITYDLDRLIEKYEAKASPPPETVSVPKKKPVVGAGRPPVTVQVSKVLLNRLLDAANKGLRRRAALVGKVNTPPPARIQRHKATFKNMIKAMVFHKTHLANVPPAPLVTARPNRQVQLKGTTFCIADSVRSKKELTKRALRLGMKEIQFRKRGLDKSTVTYLVSPEVFPTAAKKWKKLGCNLMTTGNFRKLLLK